MINIEKLRKRYEELQPPTKKVEIKPTGDFYEDLAKIGKKADLQAQVKRIMLEIESL
jgi:hypothetical protein